MSETSERSELRRDEVWVEMGGVRFADPYRWLEDDTPDVLAWQHRQDAETFAYLRSLPYFERLRDAFERGAAAMQVWAPRRHGDHWFRQEAPAADAPTRLVVADSPSAEGRVLVDPVAIDPSAPPTLDWYWPSPDGSLVAFGLSAAGSEQSVLQIVRTADGSLLTEQIPNTFLSTVSWLPDSTGFYYSGFSGPERAVALCYFHRIGAAPPAEPEPVSNDDVWLAPQVSGDGRWVAAFVGREGRPGYLIDRSSAGGWKPLLPPAPGFYRGQFHGDEMICATTDGSPRGRVVAIPLASFEDRRTWRELAPEDEAVIIQIAVVGECIVLGEIVDARARIRVLNLDGSLAGEVSLPGEGVVSLDPRASSGGQMFFAGEGEITFLYHSLTSSPAAYRYDIGARRLEQLTRPLLQHPNLTTRLAWASSEDGTRIPVEIVHRKDLDRTRPHPALVHAYGGFSYALLPGYFPHFAVFAEAGGVFAIPHCRGGTEYGREWWHAARLTTKKRTFEDLFAGAELLISENLAEAGRIAFEGASNGGVLALAAVNQRPDLWACAVSMVPLSDLMRVNRDGKDPWTGRVSYVEYGSPEDAEQAPYLMSWSPYHDVRDGAAYPAVLVCSGEADVRCPAWHARKWVARARHATSSGNPIWLRIWPAMGHGTGLTVRRQSEWLAEWMGFVFDRLGLRPPG